MDDPTDGPTDGRTDGRTKRLIEMQGSILKVMQKCEHNAKPLV